jgi:hypothetical protein
VGVQVDPGVHVDVGMEMGIDTDTDMDVGVGGRGPDARQAVCVSALECQRPWCGGSVPCYFHEHGCHDSHRHLGMAL